MADHPPKTGRVDVAWIALLTSLIAVLFSVLTAVYVASTVEAHPDKAPIEALDRNTRAFDLARGSHE